MKGFAGFTGCSGKVRQQLRKTLDMEEIMKKRKLGRTGFEIGPLVFGGNVFGWTVDAATSFALLDRFEAAGLNAIDTANSYSTWVPGNQGGESETIIGQWLKQKPGRREQTVVITKVGSEMGPGQKGLSRAHIMQAVEDSLRRLQIETIDVYLSHWPDPETPYEETLRAYEELIQQGKVRAIGSSNLNAEQLSEALQVAKEKGGPAYAVDQPLYNLYSRGQFENGLAALYEREQIGVIPYAALASGFLTGKYRSQADLGKSPRGQGMVKYLNERGLRILDALDNVSQAHGATQAEVALAWVMARPGVTAPIASATSLAQLESLIRATRLVLTAEDMELLNDASRSEAQV